MYDLLKKLCSERGMTVTQLCISVTGNSGNLATWKKGYMRSDYLAKAGDVLGVSTDFLLGRSDCPSIFQPNNSGNIINGDNTNSPLTKIGTDQSDEMQKEISSILSGLSFRERTELMTLIYKYVDEHKKGE